MDDVLENFLDGAVQVTERTIACGLRLVRVSPDGVRIDYRSLCNPVELEPGNHLVSETIERGGGLAP